MAQFVVFHKRAAKGRGRVSKGGVLEDKGETGEDTAEEEAMKEGKDFDLCDLGKGVGKGIELEKVWVDMSVQRGR